MHTIHRVSKNVPRLVCYNFDTREWILIFFGRNVTVAIKRSFTMSPQITCASALPGKTGNTKIALFTRCISALPELNQSLLDFFNLFDSRHILGLLCDSKSCNLCVELGALERGREVGHGAGEVKSRVLQQLDCVS